MSVMIYVQHLLGVGHLQRMLALADGLATEFDVALVSGGMPAATAPPGVGFVQLPPLRSIDARFIDLVDADGKPIDDAWKTRRRDALLEAYRAIGPRLLLTETYPFGRRMLGFELLPLLEAARADPNCRVIATSIRDVLQPKSKPEREREICELIARYYDYVLVHGDPALIPLASSFALAAEIADKTVYSGHLYRPPAAGPPGGEGAGEVVVSAGGSDTGLALLRCALEARALSELAAVGWRILVSPTIAEADFADLVRRAGDGITVERNRPDFPALLARARLSISQAGYNTVTELLGAGVPAVLVPFAEAGEVEQTLRARRLAERGRAVCIAMQDLDPAALAAAASRALVPGPDLALDLDGIGHSVACVRRWLAQTSESR